MGFGLYTSSGLYILSRYVYTLLKLLTLLCPVNWWFLFYIANDVVHPHFANHWPSGNNCHHPSPLTGINQSLESDTEAWVELLQANAAYRFDAGGLLWPSIGRYTIGLQNLGDINALLLNTDNVSSIGVAFRCPVLSKCKLFISMMRGVCLSWELPPHTHYIAGFHTPPLWISPKCFTSSTESPIYMSYPSAIFYFLIEVSLWSKDNIAWVTYTGMEVLPPLANSSILATGFNGNDWKYFSRFTMNCLLFSRLCAGNFNLFPLECSFWRQTRPSCRDMGILQPKGCVS